MGVDVVEHLGRDALDAALVDVHAGGAKAGLEAAVAVLGEVAGLAPLLAETLALLLEGVAALGRDLVGLELGDELVHGALGLGVGAGEAAGARAVLAGARVTPGVFCRGSRVVASCPVSNDPPSLYVSFLLVGQACQQLAFALGCLPASASSR